MELQHAKSDLSGTLYAPRRRREERLPMNEPCSLHVLHPPADTRTKVRMLDISKDGFRLRVPEHLDPGTLIQVGLPNILVLGRVRYCRKVDTQFDVGIQIDDVFPFSSLQACASHKVRFDFLRLSLAHGHPPGFSGLMQSADRVS